MSRIWRTSEDEELGPVRIDDRLPCAYLWATAMHTCLHIPMQLNSTRFLFPALAPSLTGLSFSDVQGCERR